MKKKFKSGSIQREKRERKEQEKKKEKKRKEEKKEKEKREKELTLWLKEWLGQPP